MLVSLFKDLLVFSLCAIVTDRRGLFCLFCFLENKLPSPSSKNCCVVVLLLLLLFTITLLNDYIGMLHSLKTAA